mmetsp:Transcript_28459/g.83722  ORF Transcript_28459/g.83722 Transcript_28459/m.83722 type:complete len:222 (-) Transcript_28459:16-681(-)
MRPPPPQTAAGRRNGGKRRPPRQSHPRATTRRRRRARAAATLLLIPPRRSRPASQSPSSSKPLRRPRPTGPVASRTFGSGTCSSSSSGRSSRRRRRRPRPSITTSPNTSFWRTWTRACRAAGFEEKERQGNAMQGFDGKAFPASTTIQLLRALPGRGDVHNTNLDPRLCAPHGMYKRTNEGADGLPAALAFILRSHSFERGSFLMGPACALSHSLRINAAA